MTNVQEPGVPGQTSEPATPSPSNPEAHTIALLERIEASILDLTARVAAIEDRVSELGELVSRAQPDAPPGPPRIPPFAVRNDGKVLLAVAHLAGCDLSSYERWEGVVLKPSERGAALNHLADLFEDAAARTAARILYKDTRGEDEPAGGSNQG
jgi:hypothetical protein